MTEIWKDVVGYEGKYQVSSLGRVKSLNYNRTNKEKILKSLKSNNGYYEVIFSVNGKYKHFTIHRLVAEAFLPNPNGYPQVNHKDENKLNNNVENLEWCSVSYNQNYGTINERRTITMNPHKKKVLCVETGIIYPSIMEAGRCLDISFKAISNCCNGVRNKTHNYHFEFV